MGDDGVGALADLGRTGVDRDPAIHVDLQVDGGVRELVRIPVNRQGAAGDEEATADADAFAKGHFAEFIVPAARCPDALEALPHTDARDPESGDGSRVRW